MKQERGQRFNVVQARFLKVSPRKTRIVVDRIRNARVSEALDLLRFSHKAVSRDLAKLLESGVSNIMNHATDWDVDRLIVSEAYVNEGPTMRRFRPRAMGRATRIRKRTSHVTLVLSLEE